jgi:malate dehydrogenase (oxaloacetate-decarboxylating)
VSRAEATPENIIRWTDGKAIIATGSPFPPVRLNGESYRIAQCNNSYIFPGIGLGVLAVRANRVTDEMLLASSEILAEASPRASGTGKDLLLPLQQITEVSRSIAFAVAKVAQEQGHALKISDAQLHARIDRIFWTPHYRHYKRISL